MVFDNDIINVFNSIACVNGTYGFDCNETCGKCKDQNDCFHVNGSCLNSCSPGFVGELCKTRK